MASDSEWSDEEGGILMSEVMSDLYYKQALIDPSQVSINSAFICMLHLANEKNLRFVARDEADFKILLT